MSDDHQYKAVKLTDLNTGITSVDNNFNHSDAKKHDMTLKLLRSRKWAIKNLKPLGFNIRSTIILNTDEYPNDLGEEGISKRPSTITYT